MRILYINDTSLHVGGAETNLFSIMELFNEKGNEHFLFALNDAYNEGSESSIVKRITFNLVDPKLFFEKKVYETLSQHIKKISPDIIHLHNNFLHTNSVLRALKDSGKPVVQTTHDYGVICPTAWCVKKNGVECEGGFGLKCLKSGCVWTKRFVREYLPRKKTLKLMKDTIRTFICPSRKIQEKMKANGFENTMHIPYFVRPERFTPDPGLIEDDFILYVGALYPHKGVEYLIEAMPGILEKKALASLHIVGGGPEEDRLKERVSALGLSENVFFHGRVDEEKLPELYSKANVVVVPSVWMEQFGIVGLEAMASGRPVVGSNIGGIPEWLIDGETGYLTKPRDSEDLAEKIMKILDDKKLAFEMGGEGRRICESKFMDSIVYPMLLEAYENAAR